MFKTSVHNLAKNNEIGKNLGKRKESTCITSYDTGLHQQKEHSIATAPIKAFDLRDYEPAAVVKFDFIPRLSGTRFACAVKGD